MVQIMYYDTIYPGKLSVGVIWEVTVEPGVERHRGVCQSVHRQEERTFQTKHGTWKNVRFREE